MDLELDIVLNGLDDLLPGSADDSNQNQHNALRRKFEDIALVTESYNKFVKVIRNVDPTTNDSAKRLKENLIKSCDLELKTVVNEFLKVIHDEYGYSHGSTDCSICYEALCDKPTSSLQQCHHVFCNSCLEKIRISDSYRCPKCRTKSRRIIKCII